MNFADTLRVNTFPATHDSCHLLAHLLMYFDSLYCEQYEPRSVLQIIIFLSASIGLVKIKSKISSGISINDANDLDSNL